MIYLDYNATSPMKPAVRAAVLEAMERYGNPSSVHRFGRIARRYAEEARSAVAALAGVKPAQIVFTGSGTEANNMVFAGTDRPFITSTIEHDSVLACTPAATRLAVTKEGLVDLVCAEEILKVAPPSVVSVMLANNETGVIQPVAELAQIAKRYGHLVHTDAVQAAGRLPIDFNDLHVDFLSLSAHKIGGPQGVGALIAAEKAHLTSHIRGGGQEMNRRAGTENVAGIVGFGAAAQLAADDLREVPRLTQWRDQLQKDLLSEASDAVAVGAHAPRLGNTLCIAMPKVGSETQVMAMDLAGIAVSSGSACSSGKVRASHVLRAMGYDNDVAGCAVRLSLGWNTQASDLQRCVEGWRQLYHRTRNSSQSRAA